MVVTDPEPEDLIDIMEGLTLNSTLLSVTVTYEEGRSQSTISIYQTTRGLVDRVIRSEVNIDLGHNSDHLPISMVLDLAVQRLKNRSRKN